MAHSLMSLDVMVAVLNIVMLSVIMLTFIMLSVVMLSVVLMKYTILYINIGVSDETVSIQNYHCFISLKSLSLFDNMTARNLKWHLGHTCVSHRHQPQGR